MQNSDKAVELLEMAAVKTGNHTLAVDDINWCVPQINCHCQWQFMSHCPSILNCHQGIMASQIANAVDRGFPVAAVMIYLRSKHAHMTIAKN